MVVVQGRDDGSLVARLGARHHDFVADLEVLIRENVAEGNVHHGSGVDRVIRNRIRNRRSAVRYHRHIEVDVLGGFVRAVACRQGDLDRTGRLAHQPCNVVFVDDHVKPGRIGELVADQQLSRVRFLWIGERTAQVQSRDSAHDHHVDGVFQRLAVFRCERCFVGVQYADRYPQRVMQTEAVHDLEVEHFQLVLFVVEFFRDDRNLPHRVHRER